MKAPNTERDQLPLLVGFSVLRTGEDILPGKYDKKQDVWVVEGNDGYKPIIDVIKNLAELNTKTFVEREQDDPGSMAYLESVTKTETRPERDDIENTSMLGLLQLLTKTKVQNERDDS